MTFGLQAFHEPTLVVRFSYNQRSNISIQTESYAVLSVLSGWTNGTYSEDKKNLYSLCLKWMSWIGCSGLREIDDKGAGLFIRSRRILLAWRRNPACFANREQALHLMRWIWTAIFFLKERHWSRDSETSRETSLHDNMVSFLFIWLGGFLDRLYGKDMHNRVTAIFWSVKAIMHYSFFQFRRATTPCIA